MALRDIRSVHLVYCIDQLENGKYVLLNRNYKPLGFQSHEWFDYGAYPIAVSLRITPKLAARISHTGDENTRRIYMYDERCIPTYKTAYTNDYFRRLAILAKLKIKSEPFKKDILYNDPYPIHTPRTGYGPALRGVLPVHHGNRALPTLSLATRMPGGSVVEISD